MATISFNHIEQIAKKADKKVHRAIKKAKTQNNVIFTHPTRLGVRVKDDFGFRYIEIKNGSYKVKQMYVAPLAKVKKGSFVKSGDIIGIYQTLVKRYSGITDHVHVEIKKNGQLIDPTTVIP